MERPSSALTKTELAALDVVIAGVEEGVIDPSTLGGQAELKATWAKVVRVLAGIVAATTEFVSGVVRAEDDDRLARGIQRLPANPSLDDLLELRRQVTAER